MLIGAHMEENRPPGHNAWIQGSSCHNQRIERLWRDVRHSVLNYWINFFHKMESDNLLNIHSRPHMIALHFVFLQEINSHLTQFTCAWNNHKLRTENQMTPWQLYISGMLKKYGSNYTAVREVLDLDFEVDEHFGVDVNFDDTDLQESDTVHSEETCMDIPPQLLLILNSRVLYNTSTNLMRNFTRARRATQRFLRIAENAQNN